MYLLCFCETVRSDRIFSDPPVDRVRLALRTGFCAVFVLEIHDNVTVAPQVTGGSSLLRTGSIKVTKYLTGIFDIYLFSTRTDCDRRSCFVFFATDMFLSLLALLDRLFAFRSGSAFLYLTIKNYIGIICFITYEIVGFVVLVRPRAFCS